MTNQVALQNQALLAQIEIQNKLKDEIQGLKEDSVVVARTMRSLIQVNEKLEAENEKLLEERSRLWVK